jgi:septal ring factor EnvC (AmiA/AmiB activator)
MPYKVYLGRTLSCYIVILNPSDNNWIIADSDWKKNGENWRSEQPTPKPHSNYWQKDRQQLASAVSDRAEVGRLAEQLKRREADLARQDHQMTQLRQQLTQLEPEAEQRCKQLVQVNEQQVVLPGPTIELIDPPLLTRDGTTRMQTTQAYSV